jgi:ribosomal protein S12 methylthiotransferase
MQFDHLGCFAYSKEEGTVAGRMADQIDEAVKQERLDEIMTIQREISRSIQEEKVGRVFPVLVTGVSKESELLFEGRLPTQAPEVDGVVYINDGPAVSGQIQYVEITEAHDYDLVGTIVSQPS